MTKDPTAEPPDRGSLGKLQELKISPHNAVQFWDKNSLRILAFWVLTVWVAHFFHFRHFGLYEDDYAHVSPALGWRLSDLVNYASVFLTWPQGRPIHFFLPQLISFVGAALGGLDVIYIFAFVIVTVNAFLFYLLLKRVTTETTALIGALAFCLFPADTTHTLLVHALGLQTSLTFLLIASHCYLSGKRVVSYLVIFGSLLTYESPYMVFFAMPLLKYKWNCRVIKELIRHIIVLMGMMLIVVVIRMFLGEGRVLEMRGSIGSDLFKVIAAAFIGPAVSLGQFVYAPVRTLFTWNWELTVVFAVCLGIFTWVFRRLKIDSVGEKREHVLAFNSKYLSANGIVRVCPLFPSIAKLLLVATIMLCLSYTLSFTHFPPIATRNRMTSVHLAAAFGGSLLFACFCSICLSVADAYRFRNRALFVLALYMSLVVAYRFSIQLDFCEAWQDQRSFWTNAIEKLPDMKEGTIVFVLDHDLQRTRYIASNSWADDLLLRQILTFPKQWKNPPQLFVVDDRWTESVFREGHTLKWAVGWSGGNWDVLQNANVILLEMETGKLMRRFGVINIGGEELELKPLSPEVSRDWQKGPMYSYLIDETRYPRVR